MASRKRLPDPHTAAQSAIVLGAFERYLASSPGRCVVLSRDAHGWRVSLEDSRTTRGANLLDACAQSATALIVADGDL